MSEFDPKLETADLSTSLFHRPADLEPPLESPDLGKLNFQTMADVENKDRTQRGENEASRVQSLVCWAREQVGNGPAED